MKYNFILFIAAAMAGCNGNSSSSTYVVENNGTVPYDANATITPGSNVDSIVFGDNALYVVCDGGATCDITIGDGSGNTDSHNDNSYTDNSDNSNNSHDQNNSYEGNGTR